MPLSFNTRYSSAYSSTPGSSQSANRCCAMPDHRDHGSSCTIAVALLLIDTKATNRPDGEHNRPEPLFESNPSRAQGAVMRLDTHVASRNRWTGRHRSTVPSTDGLLSPGCCAAHLCGTRNVMHFLTGALFLLEFFSRSL